MTMPESSHITDTEDQIVLSPGAVPPFCKFDWLRDHNATFALTWRAERPDLESDSDYDLSLASMALNAQWSNQEVVDLLLAWRKRHGRDHNLPQSYYVTVLARAKLLVEQTEAQDRMEEAIHMPVPDPSSRELLQSLSVIFNVSIGRFVKYDGDPPTYSVFTEKGHATIGRIDDITSQTKFRNAFAAATDILIPKCNQATWEQRAQAILQACETVNMGDSSYFIRRNPHLAARLLGTRDPLRIHRGSNHNQETFHPQQRNLHLPGQLPSLGRIQPRQPPLIPCNRPKAHKLRSHGRAYTHHGRPQAHNAKLLEGARKTPIGQPMW